MRLLLLTGSGGAGTSTLARAAVARARAAGETASLLDAPGAADALGAAWDEVLAVAAALAQVPPPPAVPHELPAPPLAAELALLLGVADAAQRADDPGLLVVDLGPVAAALRLLALPGTLGAWLDALAPVDVRVARALGGGGPGALEVLDRLRGRLGGLPAGDLRLVVRPEPAAVDEALRAVPALALLGHPVRRLVASRVVPGGGEDLWRGAVAAQHAHEVRRLRAAAPVPVDVAPWSARAPQDGAALAALAATALAEAPAGGSGAATPVAEPEGGGYVLRVPLPLARRDEVALARAGDDLVVALGGLRRRLPLPAALRRCTVEGAALRDGELRVRFLPDPDLWRSA